MRRPQSSQPVAPKGFTGRPAQNPVWIRYESFMNPAGILLPLNFLVIKLQKHKRLKMLQTMTFESLFGPVTGKQNKRRNMKNAEWKTLEHDTWFNGYTYAKGSHYKFFETANFGWVVFNQDSKTPEGDIPGKFIHRY